MAIHQFNVAPKKHRYTLEDGSAFEVDTHYVPLKVIGRGAFGMVASSLNKFTGEKVAIKKIRDVFGNLADPLQIIREIILLKNLHHPNLISLKDVMIPASPSDFNEVYMVYDLMDTDLDRVIRLPQRLDKDHCESFVFQILSGLSYLHSANVLHRDLKPANIFMNANCDLKIGDLGLARTASETGDLKTEYIVTRWYRAPELLLRCKYYDAAIDIWSVGCIFAEILGRRPVFPGRNTYNQLQLIMETIGFQSESDFEFIDYPEGVKLMKSLNVSRESKFASLFPEADPLAIDLLSKMLTLNPWKRITVDEALQHPYLEKWFDPTEFSPARHRMMVEINESGEEIELRNMIMHEIMKFHPESF